LAPGRRRTQSPKAAAVIYAQAATLMRVGVFADQSVDDIAQLADALSLDVIQLHGREDARFVARLVAATGRVIWKAVWLKSPADLIAAIDAYGETAHGLLLDSAHGQASGGTGIPFDWSLAGEARRTMLPGLKLIVAGGLTPENVRQAVTLIRPDVVDVATGVESAPGQKSHAAIAAFVRNAKL
jgi:phosphoribosylanthranilate isomerase